MPPPQFKPLALPPRLPGLTAQRKSHQGGTPTISIKHKAAGACCAVVIAALRRAELAALADALEEGDAKHDKSAASCPRPAAKVKHAGRNLQRLHDKEETWERDAHYGSSGHVAPSQLPHELVFLHPLANANWEWGQGSHDINDEDGQRSMILTDQMRRICTMDLDDAFQSEMPPH
jgi:hypothetical protein